MKKVTTRRFYSFDALSSGRLVTSAFGLDVVYSRNPYGSHNLVLVDERDEGIRHGTEEVLKMVFLYLPLKQYRKVRRFLAERGIALDWALYLD